jgi:phosphate-selective porin OprO/OprP
MLAAWTGFLGSVVAAQESDSERLNRLETRVKKQQEEIDKLKKAPPGDTPSDEGVTGSLTGGLRFKTADGDIDIHVGGRFMEHLRVIVDRPDTASTPPDTFYVEAARLRVDGTFFKDYGFQVEGDLPSSTTGPKPTLRSSFVEWKKLKELRLLFGQFKAPMSQERLSSRLFADFVENSTLTRFVPGHDIGIQAHGQLADGAFRYQVAAINGRSHLNNAGRSRNDDNDEKELVTRLTFSPWAADKEAAFLKGLRVGVSGSITEVDDVPITGPAISNFDISTPELEVTFLDPATAAGTVNLDGRRTRVGAEISWAVGPACFRAEVLLREDEMVNGALEEDVPTTAWYATFTVLLTGEDKSPERRLTPARTFDLEEGGCGAFELALRVAWAEVGDEIEDVGVSLAGRSNEVTSYTFGINWWLTRNVRISANVVREDYKDEIVFDPDHREDALTGFLARFQIDF